MALSNPIHTLTPPSAPLAEPGALVRKPTLGKFAIKNNTIQEITDINEIDVEIPFATSLFGSHGNSVPQQGNVQVPRTFYASKFFNQATAVRNAEAPLVQNKDVSDPRGRSFDQILGKFAGALHSDYDGEVLDVQPDYLRIKTAEGEEKDVDLYNSFLFNRKSSLHQTPVVKKGDKVTKGGLLARSNYTDDAGTLALGLNAKVGLVPYRGYSMDDAVVVSESFAKRIAGHHTYAYDKEFDENLKPGKAHFTGIFQKTYTKDQLDKLDDYGVVTPGMVLNPGDPMILATRPKTFSSAAAASMGNLSKSTRNARSNASEVWTDEDPGVVSDVAFTKNGVKVVIHKEAPMKVGDKLSLRTGNKGIVSLILPDDKMPRTAKGEVLEVLLNSQGLPSRVASSPVYEMLLGKIARKTGKPYVLSSFLDDGSAMFDYVEKELAKHGVDQVEEIFDPKTNRKLENPITVGDAYILKLSHVAEDKISARSEGSYDKNEQPTRGGENAAKRHSGLETYVNMSAGAYSTLREMATITGAKNDQFWRDLKMGRTPKDPGTSFTFKKFLALLSGAGLYADNKGDGNLRLGPMTDKRLASLNPVELENADIINPRTMMNVEGGLFGSAMIRGDKWGKMSLPTPMPNPAFEDNIRKLLKLTKKQFENIMAGKEEMPY